MFSVLPALHESLINGEMKYEFMKSDCIKKSAQSDGAGEEPRRVKRGKGSYGLPPP